ncbi:MAG: CRISPR-associated helicase Cas3' [Lachnospiraceae bacterium]|nr:CRISPR-associated helicase Cas3' [Lachnospiraceae bacterium]
MNLFAHLTNKSGIREEQSLRAHCVQTAEYASSCVENIGFYHMAYLAGLLHDMGKATKKYNDYLEAAFSGESVVRGSVNHTFAGIIYILENFHAKSTSPMDKLTAEIISYAIGAHHGLFDCVDLEGKNGFLHRLQKDKAELCYEEAQHNFLQQVADKKEIERLFRKATEEFQTLYQKLLIDWEGKKQKVFFQIGLLARLLLSCVIYGDRRDTAEFMEGITFLKEKPFSWLSEKEYLERKLSQFDKTSAINQVRSIISDQCLETAERPAGIYRLNVPTGAGKTLSALRYALAHAERFHKKRIIFIIPLLSVLEQNAKVIREYVQDENLVLEHHSNVVSEKEFGGDNAELDEYEILTENWESPIIISTLVQLLNILFTHKTSAIGRMRALCDSVIIIDEVQSIPKKTIAMFNMAINFLSAYCNATIVLSSATQPCLEKLDWPVKFAIQPDMVKLEKQQMEVFERADITDRTDPYGMDMEMWVDFCRSLMEERESLLVICNTKREARELFGRMAEISEAEDWYICHLSTAMCQKHRVEVLEELQNKLTALQDNLKKHQKVKKIICISTQLVEAGVDFSFDCVVRVLAGIDNLAQAAGRCNRSDEYGRKGRVYLIKLKDENLSMLKEIADAQNSTQKVLIRAKQMKDMTLTGESATQIFYNNLYQEKGMKRQIRYPIEDCKSVLYLTNLLGNDNPYAKKDEPFFLCQPFKSIGKRFEVFDDQTFDVLVPHGDGVSLIEKLREAERTDFFLSSMKNIVKQAKGYTVSIYKWQRDKLWEEGLLYGLFENRIWILDRKAYDRQYGLNEKAEPGVGNYIL